METKIGFLLAQFWFFEIKMSKRETMTRLRKVIAIDDCYFQIKILPTFKQVQLLESVEPKNLSWYESRSCFLSSVPYSHVHYIYVKLLMLESSGGKVHIWGGVLLKYKIIVDIQTTWTFVNWDKACEDCVSTHLL